MQNNNGLQEIIREVIQSTKGDPPAHKLIVIDLKKRKAVDPLLAILFGRNLKYYIVSNILDPRSESRGTFIFTYRENPPGKRSLDIEITYVATCKPGSEAKVAESLCIESDPAEALKNLIFKWIYDYIRSSSNSFIDSFPNIKDHLAAIIKNRARSETGLALEVGLSPEKLPPIEIKEIFSVRFKDYDREESVEFQAELEGDQANSVITQTGSNSSPGELIKSELRRYFANNVSLQHFYFDLGKNGFRQDIMRCLNQPLRSMGYRLQFISLERKEASPLPRPTFHLRHTVEYVIDDSSPPIKIRSEAEMDLQDSAKYRISGSRELSEWIPEQLNGVVNSALFGATYMDLLTRFDSLKGKIVQKISGAASEIGYGMKTIVTELDLDPYERSEDFEIKTEVEEFQTNSTRFPARLSIAVVAKLTDLQSARVKRYLNSRQHIPTEMKGAILKVTGQFLRSIDPERYYVRFDQTQVQNEKSVKDELEARISHVLKQAFDAEVKSINLRMEETEVVRLLNELKKYRESFAVTVSSLNPDKPYDVVFSGDFRVMDLEYDGWENFATSMPDISQIKRCVEVSIETSLQNDANVRLIYQDEEELKELIRIITDSATKAVARDFGLRITLSNIRRQRTRIEEDLTASVQFGHAALIDKLTQERKRLMDELVDLIVTQGHESAMNDLKLQISKIDSLLKNTEQSGRLGLPDAPASKQLPEATQEQSSEEEQSSDVKESSGF